MEDDGNLFFLRWEPLAKLEARYLILCDKNICTTLLLEKLYMFSWWAAERSQCITDDYHDPAVYNTLEGITTWFMGLFTVEEIERSIAFLLEKEYISVWRQGSLCKITCDVQRVKEACELFKPLPVPIHTMQHCISQYQKRREEESYLVEIDASQVAQVKALSNEEERKVRLNNARARKANLPATLTLEEWIATLDYFEWKCAYCQKVYKLLEHFIPLNHGGGTTKNNCVPACGSCNGIKQAWNPLSEWGPDMTKIREGINRVQAYLAMF